ncbi:transmembrane protein 272-like isoform X1 [Montipora foliosa]|uniref:transmembrane protein 272-like isoform X1 n=1 Tax=Montipora foliosa TaxID=591990 RepID=UPI0035F20B47
MGGLTAVFFGTLLAALAVVSCVQFPLFIADIVLGVKYKDECPVEKMIPIYLIVYGAASLFASCCVCTIRQRSGNNEERTVNPLQAVVQLFLTAWFVCGSVWVYSKYEPNYTDPGSADYCHKTLYLFAFWVTTSIYIIHGIVFVVAFAMAIVMLCKAE